MRRTRIKICGIRALSDALEAVRLGADAIGLIFYAGSPRVVSIAEAARIRAALPPFVSTVALFVNASADEVAAVTRLVKPSLLQFHGEEDNSFCAQFAMPFLKAVRVGGQMGAGDLLQCHDQFPQAAALLFDTLSASGHGGTGEVFDWSLIPPVLREKIVLAGGMTPDTVGAAVQLIRPFAVDVSSGVEVSKGVKDHDKMARFVAAVRAADSSAATN